MKCIEAKIVVLGAQGELGEKEIYECMQISFVFVGDSLFISSFLIVPHIASSYANDHIQPVFSLR